MIRDGGPAFPRPASEFTESGTLSDGNEAIREQSGMSLRDYFAAKALQGYLAAYSGTDVKMPPADHAAGWAYNYSDAMIAERVKVPA